MKLAQHYRTLGLQRGASYRDIKQAYRQLVRKYHPDLNPDLDNNEAFHKINVAYTALCENLQAQGLHIDSTASEKETTSKATGETGDRINLNDLKLTLEKLGIGRFGRRQPAPHPETTAEGTPPDIDSEPIDTVESATSPSATATDEPTAPPPEPVSSSSDAPSSPSTSPTNFLDRDANLKHAAYQQLKDLLKQQKFPRAIALVEGLAHRLPSDSEITQWQAIVYQRWARQLIQDGRLDKAERYLTKALQTDPNNPSLGREVSLDFESISQLSQTR